MNTTYLFHSLIYIVTWVGWVGGPPPHCSSHQVWMTIWGGVGVLLLLLIAHLTNSGWPFWVGWVGGVLFLLLIAHLTNSGWPSGGGVGRGWGSSSSSSLLILPTLDDHLGVGGVVRGGVLLLLLNSPTKLIAVQQWNETYFHRCMPAQLTLVPA